MARISNKALLAKYRTELARSKRWRTDEGYDDLWGRMVNLYRGVHYEDMSEDDRLVINMAFATKNVIAPSVAVNNPKFTVYSQTPDKAAQAEVVEQLINYIWLTYKYKKQFRLAVDDFLTVGHGWVKVGYKFAKTPKIVKDDEFEDEEGIDDREDKEGQTETEMNITDDRPYIERISFKDMFVNPDARNMDEIEWISQRVRRRVADVKVDKRYEASVRNRVTGTQLSRIDSHDDEGGTTQTITGVDGSNLPGTKGLGYVDVYEWYDVKRQTMCVFADSTAPEADDEGGFLIKPKKIDYAFGHPFLMLRNYNVPDYFYPMGDLEAMEALQLELNATRTQMFNHRKRFARKWLYNKDAFDEQGTDALESDDDNTMVPVGSNFKLDEVIIPMPAVGTPPDFYNQSDLISKDIDTVTATSDYMRGESPSIRRTATEAAMVQDATNARAADKLSLVEDFLAEIGERVMQLMQQYLSTDQYARIVGLTGDKQTWIHYDKNYISGKFDFCVEAGSTQPRNEASRRQAANQLMDAMVPLLPSGVIAMDQLAMYLLKEFGIKSPDAFIAPPAPPAPDPNNPSAQGGPPPEGGMPPEGMSSGQPPMGPMQAPPQEMPMQMAPPEAAPAGVPGY